MIADPALSHLLPSQRALLERFRYLTEYGDHLLVLHGASGVGKTVLAQSLLEGADEFNQAYVSAQPRMDPAQLRERIVRQWAAAAVFDPHEPLADTLERVMPDGDGRLMLIVDNAHQLADTLLAEIIALVMDQEELGLRLTLVLVCEDGLVLRLQEQLPESYQSRLIPVEVPGLSGRERRKLYDQLVSRYPGKLFINQAAVERQLAEQDGSARAVVDLVEMAKSRPPLKQSLSEQRWALIGIGAVVLGVLLWALWPSPKATPSDTATVALADHEDTVAPEVEPELSPAPGEAEKRIETGASMAEPLAVSEPVGLAKPWTPLPETSEIPTSEADTLAVDVAAQTVSESVDEAQAVPQAESAAVESEVMAPAIEDNPDALAVEAAPEPEVIQPVPLAEQSLLSRPDESYLLQLAVFSYPQLIGPFLESHGLSEGVKLYRIDREPQAWYVVVQGGFADRNAAQEAKDALVTSVKRLSPYVKSLKAVQKELSEELELAEILGQHR
ncbi:AAA family ATPase [Marinobacter hydrocarbonoclasticus]|nr:AAA family ATPase [Marinobacter nauticus]